MQTTHEIHFENSANMAAVPSASAHLVVTSPPYPMIEMWDEMFSQQDREILTALHKGDGLLAFDLMHRQLDPVWQELHRILIDGGIVCINIGDATRTIGGNFALYPNHARVLSAMRNTGFSSLPAIIWRKPTNAPNKFMGSGMLPGGAYVTLEHEYILIFRKGSKRDFRSSQKKGRRHSAFFWEERNTWFSDVWLDLVGTSQNQQGTNTRMRSAAFPFELAYRLISMFSAKDDIVVDPFLGTGTTMAAAMATARNCIGFEIETGFQDQIQSMLEWIVDAANERINQRINNHRAFIDQRLSKHFEFKYLNKYYDFPVMTRQEVDLFFNPLEKTEKVDDHTMEVTYLSTPGSDFSRLR
jgi:DNA modification methylase